MTAVLASVIAVAGTLLGASTSYLFQRLNARHAERIAREDRLRMERMAAYSDFAGAIAELLRGIVSLWFLLRQPDDFGAEARRAAYTESDRLGAAANHARFRVQMLADDPELLTLADATFEPMDGLRHAADRAELASHEQRCRDLVQAFITAASAEVK